VDLRSAASTVLGVWDNLKFVINLKVHLPLTPHHAKWHHMCFMHKKAKKMQNIKIKYIMPTEKRHNFEPIETWWQTLWAALVVLVLFFSLQLNFCQFVSQKTQKKHVGNNSIGV